MVASGATSLRRGLAIVLALGEEEVNERAWDLRFRFRSFRSDALDVLAAADDLCAAPGGR